MYGLSDYYDYIEVRCVTLAEKVIRCVDTLFGGVVASEAEYLVATAHRLCKTLSSSSKSHEPTFPLSDIAPVCEYLDLIEIHTEDFLAGNLTGAEIVREGGKELWRRYNDENRIKSLYAEGVVRQVASLSPHGNILEIGAGVGATTKRLIPWLTQAKRFVFSDVKQYFLDEAHVAFRLKNMDTLLLDINCARDDIGQFDIIYGTNVLHVARDIVAVLEWVQKHLRSTGEVVIGEGSPYSETVPWPLDLLFAFFKGWWNIPKSHLRPYPGFLLPAQWQYVFQKAGFRRIVTELWCDEKRSFGGIYLARK